MIESKQELNESNSNSNQYLNLAHQFLDTNFIESTKCNNFNILPVLSTNPSCESFVRTEPPIAVDYFSFKLTQKQYHNCWKNISNNQFMKPYELSNVDNITRLRTVQQTDDLMMFLPTTSQARLENACWRAWYKNLKNLKELNPTEINWFKENDVTVLYGPLINDDEDEDEDEDEIEEIEEKNSINYDTPLESDDEIIIDSYQSDCSSTSSSLENESDSDSLLIKRQYSLESTSTSLSTSSIKRNHNTNNDNNNNVNDNINNNNNVESNKILDNSSNCDNGKQLKSILKKRKNIYIRKEDNTHTKKRISFSHELSSVRFIV